MNKIRTTALICVSTVVIGCNRSSEAMSTSQDLPFGPIALASPHASQLQSEPVVLGADAGAKGTLQEFMVKVRVRLPSGAKVITNVKILSKSGSDISVKVQRVPRHIYESERRTVLETRVERNSTPVTYQSDVCGRVEVDRIARLPGKVGLYYLVFMNGNIYNISAIVSHPYIKAECDDVVGVVSSIVLKSEAILK